jgi:hypothetical protein
VLAFFLLLTAAAGISRHVTDKRHEMPPAERARVHYFGRPAPGLAARPAVRPQRQILEAAETPGVLVRDALHLL